ncbi:MAG TPA: c-type cytochrome, partial [Acidobacteriota bacterium]|nr:c-type cytochrome [Acidobacteriota bacterium]
TMESVSDHGDAGTIYPAISMSEIPLHGDELGHFTSACGQTIYTGGLFPDPYDQVYLVCEPVHSMIHADRLIPRGSTFTAVRTEDENEFIKSRDSWFKPVFTTNGPDGALYIVDYYRHTVEHPEFVDVDFDATRDIFFGGADRGRIYRLVPESSSPFTPTLLAGRSEDELVEALSHRNGWVRLTAQRLLVEQRDPAAVPLLERTATAGPSELGRIHALWTLEGLNALSPDHVLAALSDSSPVIQEQAIRLSEAFLSDDRVRQKLLAMEGEVEGRVAFQLACTLGEFPDRSFPVLVRLAAAHLDDSWFQIAVLTSAADNPLQWFKMTVANTDFSQATPVSKNAFIRRIGSIIGARQELAEIKSVFEFCVKAGVTETDEWGLAALEGLARGLELAGGELKADAALQRRLLGVLREENSRFAEKVLLVGQQLRLERTAQLTRLLEDSLTTAFDPDRRVEDRVFSIRTLALDPTGFGLDQLQSLIVPQEPEAVQTAALRILVRQPSDEIATALLARWRELSPDHREMVLQVFIRRRENFPFLVEAIASGQVPPSTLSSSRRRQIVRLSDDASRQKLEALLLSVDSDRREVVEAYRAAAQARGNSARGAEIFSRNCAQCHRVGQMGTEVGPDLLSVANRSRMELLSNILDPNANIVPGYEGYLVETTDGAVYTGVIAAQSDTTVTLRRAGEEDQILRSRIERMRALSVSTMPEGLEEEISLEEMADLLEFLQNLNRQSDVSRSAAE